jgi:uncharacterized protein (DUF4415 family)
MYFALQSNSIYLSRFPFHPDRLLGKSYRPLKTQISFRIDNEVLDWLKSKGQGRLSRINEILREHMTRERQ